MSILTEVLQTVVENGRVDGNGDGTFNAESMESEIEFECAMRELDEGTAAECIAFALAGQNVKAPPAIKVMYVRELGSGDAVTVATSVESYGDVMNCRPPQDRAGGNVSVWYQIPGGEWKVRATAVEGNNPEYSGWRNLDAIFEAAQ